MIPRTAALSLVFAAFLASLPLAAQQVTTGLADVTIGGRLQMQYATSSVDDAAADLFVRRGRIRVDVRVNDLLDARIQPEFAGGGAALQDAYLRFSFDPSFRLSVGQFKRAFSTFELSSSTDLPLVERDGRIEGVSGCAGVGGLCSFSRLTEHLDFDGRDTGLRVDGTLGGGFGYMATVTNGEGINTGDVNDGKSFSGRLEYETGALTLGGFYAVHDYLDEQDEAEETEYGDAVGVDVELGTWREGFHLLAAVAHGDNWQVGPEASFTSFQALASLYVPLASPRVAGIEPLLRVSWADPDSDQEDIGGTVVTPGLMLYVTGKNGIAANVDVYSPAGEGDTEWSFKLMTYFYF